MLQEGTSQNEANPISIQYVYSSELIADLCKQPVLELCLLNNVCCPRLSDAHWLQH